VFAGVPGGTPFDYTSDSEDKEISSPEGEDVTCVFVGCVSFWGL
jgi:hypothetical protein